MASRTQYELEILLGARKESSFSANINSVSKSLKGISTTAKRAAAVVTGAFAAVNITGGIKDAIDTFSNFEQSLANTAGIAGATETEYAKMEKAAREAGKSTTKTAQESAEALGYMSLAGWDVNQSTESLIPVLKLSESTQLDLATTSDLVTDSMSAMGVKTSELTKYLDIVTQENNSANTSSEQLMQAYIKSGGAARALGADLLDTSTAIGILANNGTKGEQAGTAMNAILTRLAANKDAIGAMEDLGVSIFDAKGNFIGFEESIVKINNALSGLSTQDKTRYLKNIAGTQYYSKMAYLLDSVKKGTNGTESAWESLEAELESSNGALDRMDARVTNTTSGAMQRMQSALDDLKISFADSFDGEYVEILNRIGSSFNNASEAITEFASENEAEIHNVFEEIIGGAEGIADILGKTGAAVIENFDLIQSGIMGTGAAIITSNVAGKLISVVNAVRQLSAVSKGVQLTGLAGKLQSLTSPIGLLTTGATLAVGGIVALENYTQKSYEKMVDADLSEHFGNISLSLEELDNIADDIVGKKNLTQISEMLKSIGETDNALEGMKNSFSEINAVEWKVKAGFKIDKSDVEKYKESISEYVENAKNVIQSKGYTVSIATKFLFGDDSKLVEEDNKFYAGLDKRMNSLEKQLNKKLEKAVEKGVDIDTDPAIQKILGEMSEITESITNAKNTTSFQELDLEYSGKDLTASNFKQLMKDLSEKQKQMEDGAKSAWEEKMLEINAMQQNGKLTQKQYDAKKEDVDTAFYNKKIEAAVKSTEYMVNSINQAYNLQDTLSKKFSTALKEGITPGELESTVTTIVNETKEEYNAAINKLMDSGLGDATTKLEGYKSELEKKGMEVPDSLKKGISDVKALTDMTTSSEDLVKLLGQSINQNDEWNAIVTACQEKGGRIPDGIASEITNKSDSVVSAVNILIRRIQNSIDAANPTITLSMTSSSTGDDGGRNKKTNKSNNKKGKARYDFHKYPKPIGPVKKNAKGGIYYNPILTTFAEKGAEAALPLDGSDRAKSLWYESGKILGMVPQADNTSYKKVPEIPKDKKIYNDVMKATGGKEVNNITKSSSKKNEYSINFAPVINIKGNADKQTIVDALKIGEAEFAKMMDRYLASKARVSF